MSKVIKKTVLHSVVAIDPDVDRNGVSCLDIRSKRLTIESLTFPLTLEYLHALAKEEDASGSKVIVLIEAGWLNHTHWHTKRTDSKRVIAAKGNSVGRNHEVGRKLAEMCEHWKIPYKLVKPLRKMWKGKDGKITAPELESLTGYKGRSNQEGRDSALLSWVWAKGAVNGF